MSRGLFSVFCGRIIYYPYCVMASRSSKCSCDAAEAFTGFTKEELIKLIKAVWRKFSKEFPSLKVKMYWEVFLLSRSYFGHYSLLFTIPNCHEGFKIHLIVNEEDKVCFAFDRISDIRNPKLQKKKLGTTGLMNAIKIIGVAHKLLMSMGSYHTTFNNCQNYCQRVAKYLRVSSPTTGVEAVVETSIIIVGVSIFVGLLYYLFSSGDSDDDDDKGKRKK